MTPDESRNVPASGGVGNPLSEESSDHCQAWLQH
jgi:hypothetical protein